MYRCERCGREVLEKFGSGRFCSRACANARDHSEETKKKISESVKKNPSGIASKQYLSNTLEKVMCPVCQKLFCKRSLPKHLKSHSRAAKNGVGDYLNITQRELDEYRKSHTRCEICGREETAFDPRTQRVRKLAVDHQHGTDNFRGVLCVRCNQSLGWFETHKEQVLYYLNERNL